MGRGMGSPSPGPFPPTPYSHVLAQRRLPGCAGFTLGLRRARAPLHRGQPLRRLRGRRLPARQGFCGRRGQGQAGDQVPAPRTPAPNS